MREAEIDGDASRFFLGQPIGIGASKRFDQRALAMIDVAGRGENEVRFVHWKSDSRFGERDRRCRRDVLLLLLHVPVVFAGVENVWDARKHVPPGKENFPLLVSLMDGAKQSIVL